MTSTITKQATSGSAGAPPPIPGICTCDTPNTYLTPIIGCVNRRCRPRYYHLSCLGLKDRPVHWSCPSCAPPSNKRKSDESDDDMPRKRRKMAELVAFAADVPLAVVEQLLAEEPGADNDAESVEIEEAEDDVVAGLPAVGASGDTPILVADDDDGSASASEDGFEDGGDDEPESESSRYCVRDCRRETGGMVGCDGEDCAGEWFHFACIGMTSKTIPEGEWFCDDCAGE
ncbi:uncharacterized protein J4E79_008248 [Alternaria viburni]|uniref:uncharacterized protein n=1 Tax=Alternaria viburni TaxID=566460 RepID=UPI0020C4B1A3|nr:uncharacterized protein J4E79_008248 [Alternaria viburni]KAI4655183.1 hypothetical protein J4E79_008248 [Alternaria viburni]